MKTDELFLLGKIVRTFGSKGELIFQFNSEIITSLKKLESVFVHINGNLVPFFIEQIRPRPKNQAQVKLMDVEETDDASLLAGCDIYIPVDLLPKQKSDQFYAHEIEGYSVIDSHHGNIGIVRDILEMPQQSLLAVEFNGKEILIPVVEEIIKKVDRRKKEIQVEAPEGLIELYL